MSAADSIIGYAGAAAGALGELFWNAGSFLSPLPLIVAGLIAGLAIARRMRAAGEKANFKKVSAALFPADVWRHRSTRHDILIILINDGLLFFLPALTLLTAVAPLHALLTANAGGGSAAPGTDYFHLAVFAVYVALAWDFFATYTHYLKHKVPALWEFHKVHHCAEVMTPLTAMRRHPVEIVFSALVSGIGVALAISAWTIIFGAPGAVLEVGGVALIVYLWRLVGYNIRHSHVWISYGPFWNRFLMSPAHHQLHHSREARHHDCNFGHIFTVWDWMFGTLYKPVEGEHFEFGIDRAENTEFNSLAALYILPVRKAFARFAPAKALPPPSAPAAARE